MTAPFQSIGGTKAVLREKTIVVQDSDGHDLVLIGRLADGEYGIEIRTVSGQTTFKTTNEGQVWPYQYATWTGGAALATTTSVTYEELFRVDFGSTGAVVEYDIQADNAGGVLDVSMTIAEQGASQVTVMEQLNASGELTGNFTINAGALVSGADPAGRTMSLRILARRRSGAGSPSVRLNAPLYNRPA